MIESLFGDTLAQLIEAAQPGSPFAQSQLNIRLELCLKPPYGKIILEPPDDAGGQDIGWLLRLLGPPSYLDRARCLVWHFQAQA